MRLLFLMTVDAWLFGYLITMDDDVNVSTLNTVSEKQKTSSELAKIILLLQLQTRSHWYTEPAE